MQFYGFNERNNPMDILNSMTYKLIRTINFKYIQHHKNTHLCPSRSATATNLQLTCLIKCLKNITSCKNMNKQLS